MELIGHYVAYRKLVSPSPSALIPEEQFRLYAICARSPQELPRQVPWQRRQSGVYDCQWGTAAVRVIVAGELAREAQNAPLHLFSASPELVGFGSVTYRRHSDDTSTLIGQLFERFKGEGFSMAFTMSDFRREYIKEHLPELPPEQQEEILKEILHKLPAEARLAGLPPEARLAGLSAEQIRNYLEHLTARRKPQSRKPRRRK
jgi:hypothetical protein